MGRKGLGGQGSLIGKQGVIAALKHSGRKIPHDWFRLNMEVAEHLVGLPAAEEPDAITIDISAEEGHSTGSAKETCGYVAGAKAIGGAQYGHGEA